MMSCPTRCAWFSTTFEVSIGLGVYVAMCLASHGSGHRVNPKDANAVPPLPPGPEKKGCEYQGRAGVLKVRDNDTAASDGIGGRGAAVG